jgi:hypothetical protein
MQDSEPEESYPTDKVQGTATARESSLPAVDETLSSLARLEKERLLRAPRPW